MINTLNRFLDKNMNLLEKYKTYLFFIIFLYILTRDFSELLIGNLLKNISFLLIILGIFSFVYEYWKKRLYLKLDKNEKIIILIFILYIFYVLFNGIIHMNLPRLVKSFKEYVIFPLIIFSTLYYFKNNDNENKFFDLLAKFSIIISILSIYELLANRAILPLEIDPLNKTRYYLVYGDTLIFRARTLFGSFQVNGLFLSIAALINVHQFYSTKNIKYVSFAILNFIGLNCSCARGPLLAFIISFIFLTLVYYCKSLKYFVSNISTKQRYIYALSLIIVFSILVFIVVNNINFGIPALEFFNQRIKSMFNWSASENSNNTRKGIWLATLKMFIQYPIFGIGVSATGSGDLGTISIGVTESGVLKRLVETGVIGFILYYSSYFGIICSALKNSMYSIFKMINENVLYLSIIISVFIEDITLQITEDYVIAFLLYFTIGILCKKCNLFCKGDVA